MGDGVLEKASRTVFLFYILSVRIWHETLSHQLRLGWELVSKFARNWSLPSLLQNAMYVHRLLADVETAHNYIELAFLYLHAACVHCHPHHPHHYKL